MSASISLSAQQGKGAVGGTWGFTLPSCRFLGRAQRQRVRAAAARLSLGLSPCETPCGAQHRGRWRMAAANGCGLPAAGPAAARVTGELLMPSLESAPALCYRHFGSGGGGGGGK